MNPRESPIEGEVFKQMRKHHPARDLLACPSSPTTAITYLVPNYAEYMVLCKVN